MSKIELRTHSMSQEAKQAALAHLADVVDLDEENDEPLHFTVKRERDEIKPTTGKATGDRRSTTDQFVPIAHEADEGALSFFAPDTALGRADRTLGDITNDPVATATAAAEALLRAEAAKTAADAAAKAAAKAKAAAAAKAAADAKATADALCKLQAANATKAAADNKAAADALFDTCTMFAGSMPSAELPAFSSPEEALGKIVLIPAQKFKQSFWPEGEGFLGWAARVVSYDNKKKKLKLKIKCDTGYEFLPFDSSSKYSLCKLKRLH